MPTTAAPGASPRGDHPGGVLLLAGLAILAVFVLADLLVYGTAALSASLALRAGAVISLLAPLALLRRIEARLGPLAGTLGPSVGVVVFLGLLALSGGLAGRLQHWIMAIPFFLLILAPRRPTGAVLAGAVLVVGLVGTLWLTGARRSLLVNELATVAAADLVALLGGLSYRRLHARELAAERARAEGAERLAETEARLRESDRLALLGQLAAGITHDIKNPLAYVQANLAFLDEALAEPAAEDPAELRSAAREALDGAHAIARIVQDMGRFARAGDVRVRAPVDLAELAAEAVRLTRVRLAPFAPVRVDVPGDLPAAVGDPQALLRVLVNLLANAADALRGAGRTGDGQVGLRAWRAGGRVHLAVEDDGPGVPPAIRDRVFQAFFTTKPPGEGTGLGLAMAADALAAMGGRLALESPEAGGARFVLTLDADLGEAQGAGQAGQGGDRTGPEETGGQSGIVPAIPALSLS